jgi:O-antigen biosynthesis protein
MISIFKKKYTHEIAICAVAKNEEAYIEEWVIHHLAIGFEKIYIYDNNDVFGKLTLLLKQYIDQDKVQIIDCSGINPVQLWAYMHFIRTNKKIIKWAAFIDVDEFIELEKNSNIHEFVSSFKHAQVIVLSWLGYGANNKIWKEDGDLKSRFPESAAIDQMFIHFPMHVKSMTKLRCVKKFLNPHMPKIKGKRKRDRVIFNATGQRVIVNSSYPLSVPVYKKAYINHYFTKSYEEWLEKISKGSADHANRIRKIDEFFYLNTDMRNLNLPKTLEGLNELKLKQQIGNNG